MPCRFCQAAPANSSAVPPGERILHVRASIGKSPKKSKTRKPKLQSTGVILERFLIAYSSRDVVHSLPVPNDKTVALVKRRKKTLKLHASWHCCQDQRREQLITRRIAQAAAPSL